MNKIEQQNKLEKELHSRILNMFAGNFDRWDPDADPETVSARIRYASLSAAGIVKKLSGAIAECSIKITPSVWRKMVRDATRDSFHLIGDSEPMVKLGAKPSVLQAIEECTASAIAPSGSEWARKLDKRKAQRLRKSLSGFNLPPRLIDEMVRNWAKELR